MFPTEQFQEVLKDFVEARLHTDRPGLESTEQAIELQKKMVGSRALPAYVILDPATGETIAQHVLQLANQEAKLLDFLKQGLQAYRDRHANP